MYHAVPLFSYSIGLSLDGHTHGMLANKPACVDYRRAKKYFGLLYMIESQVLSWNLRWLT